MTYKSLRTVILEMAKGAKESDQNDQIAVGSYTTKSFEFSPQAQILYSDLPKDTNASAAQTAAEALDRLFDVAMNVENKGFATAADVQRAKIQAEIVRKNAADMNLEKEHESIIAPALNAIKNLAGDIERYVDPKDDYHPADDKRFHSPPEGNNPDPIAGPQGDRDIDNVKKYLIKRSRAAERKIKIIDAD